MFSSKKGGGNFAPIVTTGIVLFNVFLFILISAFASDNTNIGVANDIYSSIDQVNETTNQINVVKPTFLDKFLVTITDMPWWVNVFIVFVNLLLIPIAILAWVRGL